MTLVVVIAGLHYISIMVLAAALVAEHLMLKPQLTVEQARSLRTLDAIYGFAALGVLVTGIARVFTEKGLDYYLHTGAFHAVVSLFLLAGLLSLYPTIVFLRWRQPLSQGRAPELDAATYKKVKMILRIELLLIFLIPFFAAWMARGV